MYLSVFKDKFDLRSMKGEIKFILWVIIIDVFDYIEGFFLNIATIQTPS